MKYSAIATTWADVLATLDGQDPGTVLRLAKWHLPHPTDEGARSSIGMPEGQKGDYRFPLRDCECLHVRVFDDRYEAHIDTVDPACNWLEHLRHDLPGGYVATAGGVGALLGLILGGKREAMLVGGLVGMAIGAITLPPAETKKKRTKAPGIV